MRTAELVRAFVAVEVSVAVRHELAELLENLRTRTALRVKWVKSEQMHLTLAFLGEVSWEFIESVKAQLARVASRFEPIPCQLSGCGAFPSPARARVLWVGISEGREELARLASEVNGALREIGFRPEDRPFKPHLTLGRLREPADVSLITGQKFTSSGFMVSRLVLFRSVLKPQGPEYSELAEFPFGQ